MIELPDPTFERIDSRAGLDAGVDRILPLGRRRILVFETSLGPAWNRAERIAVLRQFFLDSRRGEIRFLLHDPQSVYARNPRVVELLRRFSHMMTIHQTPHQAKAVYDPFVICDERHYIHRFHFNRGFGTLAIDDAIGAETLFERFEELWSNSEPAISATTLGL